ncbi:MAG: hypothetical protein JWM36_2463 [Hyphomicrobiales bacterium]|nr:hypothetical protein [Hyphomicrobiales bacterium]
MPIRPQLKWLYPLDWPELSRAIRFRRAKGNCEACGRPHGRIVMHLGDGRWWDAGGHTWRNDCGRSVRPNAIVALEAVRTTRVILATAHLDHDPANNVSRNLKALCQRCHLNNDRPEHLRRRFTTYRMRRALGDLFLGPYS